MANAAMVQGPRLLMVLLLHFRQGPSELRERWRCDLALPGIASSALTVRQRHDGHWLPDVYLFRSEVESLIIPLLIKDVSLRNCFHTSKSDERNTSQDRALRGV
jgi:hypothetical protein